MIFVWGLWKNRVEHHLDANRIKEKMSDGADNLLSYTCSLFTFFIKYIRLWVDIFTEMFDISIPAIRFILATL